MNNTCPRLIEVALPIREISSESLRDKNIHQSHIRNLHVWWARRPLAASRAVVFASFVPDPDHSDCPPEFRQAVLRLLRDEVPPVLKAYRRGRDLKRDPDPYKPYADIPDTARNRLLTFIAKYSPEWQSFEKGLSKKQPAVSEILDDRALVKWETSDPKSEQGRAVLSIARELIRIANNGEIPALLDPFSGGGAIPLEAQRLGFRAIANDYNPVAYLILRATCEFPQKFGKPGKRMVEREEYGQTKREEIDVDNVLAYDIGYWADWILELARQRIGHLYPSGKDGLPVIGYLWARTVRCSNPACRAEIPLLRNLLMCDKPGKKIALTVSVLSKEVVFGIARNTAIQRTNGTMIGGGDSRCPVCEQVTPVEDVRLAGLDGKLGERLVAVIIDTPSGKEYRLVEPIDSQALKKSQEIATTVERPGERIPENQWNIKTWLYGMNTWGSLFNPRQLTAIQSFVLCLQEACKEINKLYDDEYRNAIITYLGMWISRIASFDSTVCIWANTSEIIKNPFGRQALPINWDYPEANPFSDSSGSASTQVRYMLDVVKHESFVEGMGTCSVRLGTAEQLPFMSNECSVVVTDPPYFDAIAYADLSDFFYIWLKRTLENIYPDVLNTPLTPKSDEATALKHRHGGDMASANAHFTNKLIGSFTEAKRVCNKSGVVAVMFAHQSTEAWTALVNALFESGLNITATYPIDTELTTALKKDMSALASSITVVCRPRQAGGATSFRDVRREVEQTVAESVHRFWEYGFRGADLIVACYGPAVGVFGRYSRVERADGTPVSVPELLDLARESALKAIAGVFTGDPLSRLYFVWANLYGITEQSWDDARLVIQIGGESENAMEVARERSLFVVNGATCRLALLKDRIGHKHLGDESDAPLIDQLHHAMQLWKEEKRADLVAYLRENTLLDHAPYWKLAQALFEVLPRDEEDWKLIASLLGERETLRLEAKRGEEPKQKSLFEQ